MSTATERKKEYMKKWREDNKEHLKTYTTTYEKNNKEERKRKRLEIHKTKGVLVSCLECSENFFARKANLDIGKDKYCSKDCFNVARSTLRGSETSNWKGNNVKYSGLHMWVRSMLGEPSKCEHCETTTAKKFEWANKNHTYFRNITDWVRLCTSCHRKYDYTFNKKTT